MISASSGFIERFLAGVAASFCVVCGIMDKLGAQARDVSLALADILTRRVFLRVKIHSGASPTAFRRVAGRVDEGVAKGLVMCGGYSFSRWSAIALLSVLAGCASVPDSYRDPRDPWEPYNRSMHQFNSDFDTAFFRPVAEGYKFIMPEPLNRGVTNFFNNMRDFTSAINNLLQLKLSRAVTDVGRIAINSTVGLLGFVDVATNLDLPSYKEDFGQTLGYWGVAPGPYFVLPVLGPSSVRDGIAIVPDWYTQPVALIDDANARWGLAVLFAVDKRADLLGASKLLDTAALDPYSFTRDAYFQRRRHDVYDGNPPREDDFFDESWDTPPPDQPQAVE
jgi:phospholipid-binding lipoprotein MlaA